MIYLNISFFFILLNILLSDCDLTYNTFSLNLTQTSSNNISHSLTNLSITNEINLSNNSSLNISQITNSPQPTPSKYSHDPNDNNRTAVILSGQLTFSNLLSLYHTIY
jgi:hypothetical protein